MNSETSKVHEETRNIFEKHKKVNLNKKGKRIARELDELRNYRNLVDYDAGKLEDIKFAYTYCKSRSEKIFKLLDDLS